MTGADQDAGRAALIDLAAAFIIPQWREDRRDAALLDEMAALAREVQKSEPGALAPLLNAIADAASSHGRRHSKAGFNAYAAAQRDMRHILESLLTRRAHQRLEVAR